MKLISGMRHQLDVATALLNADSDAAAYIPDGIELRRILYLVSKSLTQEFGQ